MPVTHCQFCEAVNKDPVSQIANTIHDNVRLVSQTLAQGLRPTQAPAHPVTLIAVSKHQPAAAIAAAHQAGVLNFGENYVQEAVGKINELHGLNLTWHFIGPLQSNKTLAVAQHFDWVHTVDRLKIAQRLSRQRSADQQPLNICLQVNLDGDPNKSGVEPTAIAPLLQAVVELPHIQVRGLMTILAKQTPPTQGYDALAQLFQHLTTTGGPAWDSLSMGMSGDYPLALAAGASHVRVGTAIFGARP